MHLISSDVQQSYKSFEEEEDCQNKEDKGCRKPRHIQLYCFKHVGVRSKIQLTGYEGIYGSWNYCSYTDIYIDNAVTFHKG